MRALEPRVLLDAAGLETALDVVNDTVHSALADDWFARRAAGIAEPAFEDDLSVPDDEAVGVEYVFFAPDVENADALIAELPTQAQVVMLDEQRDGVEQMAEVLHDASDVRAIHIVSHGRAGALSLGIAELTAETMAGHHADALARIGRALDAEGDLLIYGCDFAAGATGAAAVDRLSLATGADVAASTDTTGGAQAGGDWTLERRTGLVEAAAIDGGEALGLEALRGNGHLYDDMPDPTGVAVELAPGERLVQAFTINGANVDDLDHIHLWIGRTAGGSVSTLRLSIVDLETGEIMVSKDTDGDKFFGENPENERIEFRADRDGPYVENDSDLKTGRTYALVIEAVGGSDTFEIGTVAGAGPDRGALFRPDGQFDDRNNVIFDLEGDPDLNAAAEPLAPVLFEFGAVLSGSNDVRVAVPENTRDVRTFVVIDLDGDPAAAAPTYRLEGADAALFEMDGDTLRFRTAPDFETDPGPFIVEVTAELEGQAGETRTFTIDVTDVANEPPPDTAPSTNPMGLVAVQGERTPITRELFGVFDPDPGENEIDRLRITAQKLRGGSLVIGDPQDSASDIEVASGRLLTASELDRLVFVADPADDGGAGGIDFKYVAYTGNSSNPSAPGAAGTFEIEINARPRASVDEITAWEDTTVRLTETTLGLFDPNAADGVEDITITRLPEADSILRLDGVAVSLGDTILVSRLDDLTLELGPDRVEDVSIEYTLTDTRGAQSLPLTLSIDVLAVDDAPTADGFVAAPLPFVEDGLATIAFDAFPGRDVDGQTIERVAVDRFVTGPSGEPAGMFTGGTVEGDLMVFGRDDLITFQPAQNFYGPVVFDYWVENTLRSVDAAQGAIDVAPRNDAPRATMGNVVWPEGELRPFAANDFIPDDGSPIDVDHPFSELTLVITAPDATSGTLLLLDDGGNWIEIEGQLELPLRQADRLSFQPAQQFVEPIVFDFVIRDPLDGESAPETFTIFIAPRDDAPVVTDLLDSRSDSEGTAIVPFSVFDAFEDPEQGALRFGARNLPDGLELHETLGTISGTISPLASTLRDPAGSELVTITAYDEGGQSVSQSFDWEVLNPVPVAADSTFELSEDEPSVGQLVGMDDDDLTFLPDGDAVSGGTVEIAADGSFTFALAQNGDGTITFGYEIHDGQGASDSASVTINVLPGAPPVSDDLDLAAEPDAPLPLAAAIRNATGDPIEAIWLVGPLPAIGMLVVDDPMSGGTVPVESGQRLTVQQFASLVFEPGEDTDVGMSTNFRYVLEKQGLGALSAPVSVSITIAQRQVVTPAVTPGAVNLPQTATDTEEPDESEEEEAEEDTEDEMSDGGSAETRAPNLPEPTEPVDTIVVKPAPARLAPPAVIVEPKVEIIPRSSVAPDVKVSEPTSPVRPSIPTGIAGYSFTPMEPATLAQAVERAGNDVREYDEVLGTTAAKVTFAFGSVLAVGSVSYLIQGGAVAGALLSALPAWRRYDPIEIVAGRRDDENDDEPSTVEQMRSAVEGARARVEGVAPSNLKDTP